MTGLGWHAVRGSVAAVAAAALILPVAAHDRSAGAPAVRAEIIDSNTMRVVTGRRAWRFHDADASFGPPHSVAGGALAAWTYTFIQFGIYYTNGVVIAANHGHIVLCPEGETNIGWQVLSTTRLVMECGQTHFGTYATRRLLTLPAGHLIAEVKLHGEDNLLGPGAPAWAQTTLIKDVP